MNNKTVQFTCKTCHTPVYRLGSRVNKQDGLCGKCNQGDPQTVQAETLNQVKVEDQVKVETPIDPYKKALEDYNKQWEKDKLETQSFEKFLDGNKAAYRQREIRGVK